MKPSYIHRLDNGLKLAVELVWGDLSFEIVFELYSMQHTYRCMCGWKTSHFKLPSSQITSVYYEIAQHCNTAHYGELDLEGWLLKSEPYLVYAWPKPISIGELGPTLSELYEYQSPHVQLSFKRFFKQIPNLVNHPPFTFPDISQDLATILSATGFCYQCESCGWMTEPYEAKQCIAPKVIDAIEQHIDLHKYGPLPIEGSPYDL